MYGSVVIWGGSNALTTFLEGHPFHHILVHQKQLVFESFEGEVATERSGGPANELTIGYPAIPNPSVDHLPH